MQNPVNLQVNELVNFIAGAHPAYVNGTLIAAPGAGFRLRIWGFGTSLITGVGAAALWHVYFRPIDDSFRVPMSGAREAFIPGTFPPGGFILPENVGFEISATVTGGGSRTMPSWVMYTIEIPPT